MPGQSSRVAFGSRCSAVMMACMVWCSIAAKLRTTVRVPGPIEAGDACCARVVQVALGAKGASDIGHCVVSCGQC